MKHKEFFRSLMIWGLNLVELEKKEGLDLGGRRALRERKKQLRQAERVGQAVNNDQAVNGPVLRQQS